MTKTLRANLLLVLTAIIWGTTFVAQGVAMDSMGPFTFNAVRLILAVIVLLPTIRLLDRLFEKRNGHKPPTMKTMTRDQKRRLLIGGVVCGLVLSGGMAFQQYGMVYSSPGKAGFITALYIVLVPVVGIAFRHRARLAVWIAVGLCLIGLYFLTVTEALTIGFGDVLLLICALFFTAHILVIAHYSPQVDGVRLSCMQFAVAAVIFSILTLLFEKPQMASVMDGWIPIVYAGVLSCCVAYTLQIIAQKDTTPAVASLLMSLESVFAVLGQWVVLGELLTGRELFGCALMFIGIILSQLPERKPKSRPVEEAA
ncbi:MAG TPA: DMT family transporter [Candidatus Limiplasma sp.]|nr:DMT family transporter [Candidatus Limiplasma sp.]HRX07535.1 DMT family transporter [Candidatus Limiplasma sp.]